MEPSVLQRLVVGLLRLPGRTLPIPGWFPLVVEPVHARLGLGSSQTVVLGDWRLELDITDYVQRRIFYNTHEIPEARWIARFLRRGARVLDIGANIGYFTLIAARNAGSAGRVVAVEPVPENTAALSRNVHASGAEAVVELHEMAAGSTDGMLSIGLPFVQSGEQTPTSGDFTAYGTIGSVEVPVRRLDEVFADSPPFDLVKVDVEGMEPEVLRGMNGLFEGAPPEAVLLEINPRALARGGFTAHDVFEPLEQRGYVLHRIGILGGTGRRLSASDFPAPASEHVNARGWRLVIRGLRGQDKLESVVAVRTRTNQ